MGRATLGMRLGGAQIKISRRKTRSIRKIRRRSKLLSVLSRYFNRSDSERIQSFILTLSQLINLKFNNI